MRRWEKKGEEQGMSVCLVFWIVYGEIKMEGEREGMGERMLILRREVAI